MLLSCELQLSPTLEQALRVRHFWLLWQLLLRISSLQIETLPVKLLHYAVCSSIPTSFPTTHTHTNLHTHTQLLRTLLIFHVYEISFSVPLWDTLSTCVQSILPITKSSFNLFSCVRLCATPWTAAHQIPCSSPTPRACWNSSPLNPWCHPTISCSFIPFSLAFIPS